MIKNLISFVSLLGLLKNQINPIIKKGNCQNKNGDKSG